MKKRLTWSVVLLSTCLILISLIFSYFESRHEIREVYDARLGQSAKMALLSVPSVINNLDDKVAKKQLSNWMAQLSQQADSQGGEGPTDYGHPYERNILIQYYRDGKMLWSSIPSMTAINHNPDYYGYGYVSHIGKTWRFFQLRMPDSDDYVVTAEKLSIRHEMINELALSTALPQLILIPCLGIVMALLIERNFKPITELRSAISQRNINKLDKIYVQHPTTELTPLVAALNTLLGELDEAWQREKRFTRMAAHELKTPLTILRLNAENAFDAPTKEQLTTSLNHILAGIDRTDRLIQQLLMLARVESVKSLQFVKIELAEFLQSVLAEIAPMALKQDQELSLDANPAVIMGDPALLRVLFLNLLDNAIRYSGKRTAISVVLTESDDHFIVNVSDSGKPIEQEVRDKLFDNFYRANSERGDGAGLGMSITRDIAKLHHGNVALLDHDLKGNTFQITLKKHNL
ncbi:MULTISPECIES: ATP-binding protein [Vibrio]|nr:MULTISPECIES: ATP-binding protein [Vibrio]